MPIQFEELHLPTIEDTIQGVEVMQGVSEHSLCVTLTPCVGVDRAMMESKVGRGVIKFKDRLVSHDEVNQLRKELELELTMLRTELARLKLSVR